MRVNRGGIQQLARGVNHSHLHPRADAGIQAHHGLCSGGGSEQQVMQIAGEDANSFFLGAFAQLHHQFAFQMQRELDQPGPARRFQ